MDASILLVGGKEFRIGILNAIQNLANFTVELIADPLDALHQIEAQQPDLLLIQASRSDSLELCRQVKAQPRLVWIYCIFVEDRSPDAATAPEIALETGADAHLLFALDELSELPAPLQQDPTTQVRQQRLLQAHLRVGLRQVQNYRQIVRTNDLLSVIALSDPLTELNNRRAFEWELPRQIQNARSRHQPISLIMLDVDFFKSINDTHGHLVGDRALQLLSARLRHNLRFYDTPFRYGGEEFVIILSDTDCPEASMIANRLCQLIGEQPFVISETLELSITISAGAATLIASDDAKGISLLERADDRLLQAKARGRNCVVSCENL